MLPLCWLKPNGCQTGVAVPTGLRGSSNLQDDCPAFYVTHVPLCHSHNPSIAHVSMSVVLFSLFLRLGLLLYTFIEMLWCKE